MNFNFALLALVALAVVVLTEARPSDSAPGRHLSDYERMKFAIIHNFRGHHRGTSGRPTRRPHSHTTDGGRTRHHRGGSSASPASRHHRRTAVTHSPRPASSTHRRGHDFLHTLFGYKLFRF
ncbi:hypothetical protein M3Y94_00083800 [Aphelenchoides besseyi]|nr:hypothetical protein M3Y94_00083800 [Aphelenchoides besseyi]KAI6237758.1 hypothetical protein M3Y95_00298700 [Aphelenchoides besseyi]